MQAVLGGVARQMAGAVATLGAGIAPQTVILGGSIVAPPEIIAASKAALARGIPVPIHLLPKALGDHVALSGAGHVGHAAGPERWPRTLAPNADPIRRVARISPKLPAKRGAVVLLGETRHGSPAKRPSGQATKGLGNPLGLASGLRRIGAGADTGSA